jgi:hypothetical protein
MRLVSYRIALTKFSSRSTDSGRRLEDLQRWLDSLRRHIEDFVAQQPHAATEQNIPDMRQNPDAAPAEGITAGPEPCLTLNGS